MKKIFLLFSLSFGIQTLFGQTFVDIIPAKDNTIFSESNALSNGLGSDLFAGTIRSGAFRRILLSFSLNTIPVNAKIDSVVLILRSDKSRANATFTIRRLTSDWGEGTSNSTISGGGQGATATVGDATWANNFYNTTTWSSAGGDFDKTTVSATFNAISTSVINAKSTQLTKDVIDWYTGDKSNFGWIIIGNESASGTAHRFDSKHATELTSQKPTLRVFYSIQTSIDDNISEKEKFYPNPANDVLTFDKQKGKVVIINSFGQIVMQSEATGSISLEGIPQGIYFVKFAQGDNQLHKLIIE